MTANGSQTVLSTQEVESSDGSDSLAPESGTSMVHVASEEVVDTAAAAKAAMRVRVANTLEALLDAGAAAHGYAASAQSAVACTWEELTKKGTRAFLLDTASDASEKMRCAAEALVDATSERCDGVRRSAVERATGAADLAKTKAHEVGAAAQAVATDRKFQATAVSAASGAVALSTTGGATGLVAGGALGAAVGAVPALFTFGLSIPIGAAIGSGAGLMVGTAVGGTVGAVGGGAAGYGVCSKEEDIGKCADLVKTKATEATELVKGQSKAAYGRAMDAADFTKAKAYASAEYVAERASAARSSLAGRCGTGGAEVAD
eukprot:CAMPEP_0175199984 /NCGR_PEP_ID=MMETSP0093-20121207/9309_1 /TAXON_ID=311494 /ORGANISM="Alexandrium monilatum, Strain CCMP3105" /LENGTH=318 /DNA_ID=CAMNT_0016492995 /DNA_START=102 /DNA_END=1058 /DNA_ORIENTATION=-